MSRWHKLDPPDVLWPPEPRESWRESNFSAMAVYTVWQKLLRGIPLSARDEEVLGMPEQEWQRRAELERNKILARWAEERRANRLSARVRRFIVHIPHRLSETWSELCRWWWSLPVRSG